MRQRGRGPEQNERAAMQIHFREARFDEVRDILLRHAFSKGREGGAEHVKGGVASKAHQFEFVRGFVRAASNRYRIGRDVFKSGRGIAQMIEECEAARLFNPNAASANVLVGQRGSRDFCRALVFLPNAHLDRQMQLLAQPPFLKSRNNKHRMPSAMDDQANQPLAKPPSNSREVVERCARGKEERVIFCSLRGRAARRERRSSHKLLRPFNALPKFVRSDSTNAFPQWLKPGK